MTFWLSNRPTLSWWAFCFAECPLHKASLHGGRTHCTAQPRSLRPVMPYYQGIHLHIVTWAKRHNLVLLSSQRKEYPKPSPSIWLDLNQGSPQMHVLDSRWNVTTLNGNIGQKGLIINRLFELYRLLLLSTTLLIKYNLGFCWVKFDSIDFCFSWPCWFWNKAQISIRNLAINGQDDQGFCN